MTKVLLGLVETLRAWSDDDLRSFLAGEREMVVRVPSRPTQGRMQPDQRTSMLAAEVASELGSMETREEGIAYLSQLKLTRNELRRLVTALDLPMSHGDNMERLRARIVEALIGYRLRSRAIRGTSASAGNHERDRRDIDPPVEKRADETKTDEASAQAIPGAEVVYDEQSSGRATKKG